MFPHLRMCVCASLRHASFTLHTVQYRQSWCSLPNPFSICDILHDTGNEQNYCWCFCGCLVSCFTCRNSDIYSCSSGEVYVLLQTGTLVWQKASYISTSGGPQVFTCSLMAIHLLSLAGSCYTVLLVLSVLRRPGTQQDMYVQRHWRVSKSMFQIFITLAFNKLNLVKLSMILLNVAAVGREHLLCGGNFRPWSMCDWTQHFKFC